MCKNAKYLFAGRCWGACGVFGGTTSAGNGRFGLTCKAACSLAEYATESGECASLSSCQSDEYEYTLPTATTDRVCKLTAELVKTNVCGDMSGKSLSSVSSCGESALAIVASPLFERRYRMCFVCSHFSLGGHAAGMVSWTGTIAAIK
jgi:hypothetical protein